MTSREILTGNTDAFIRMINAYPDELFTQKPDEDSWSASEIAEHIYRSEFGISKLFLGDRKPSDGTGRSVSSEKMKAAMMNTDKKVKASGPILPKGQFKNKSELIDTFKENRHNMLEAYSTINPDEICLTFEHPLFGHLTAAEWLEFAAYHTQRHMMQMEETLSRLRS